MADTKKFQYSLRELLEIDVQVSPPIQKIFDFIKENEGNRVAVFLHTSMVLEKMKYLNALSKKKSRSVKFYLPENCYYELKLLAKYSSKETMRKKAANMLSLFGSSLSWSHKVICDQKSSVATHYAYDAGLFVFYEPAAAQEFSRRFSSSVRNFILSYNLYEATEKECNYCKTGTAIARRCTPLKNTPVLNKGKYQTLSVIDSKMNEVKQIPFSSLEKMGLGAEADIYTTPYMPGKCIKIYRDFTPGESMERKLKFLMHCYGRFDCCVFPSELVYSEGKCIGFVMDKVQGDPLRKVLYSKKYDSDSARNNLLINLSVSFLEARIAQLVVADLSLKNIYVTADGRVVFIDVDSMEAWHYPGGGITPPYGHPDITVLDSYKRLRTFEESSFSYAVLMFYMTLGWEHPLTQGGIDGDPVWKTHRFPLGNAPLTGEGCIVSGTRLNDQKLALWKSQPKAVRDGFIDVFNFTSTYDVGEWLSRMSWKNKLI